MERTVDPEGTGNNDPKRVVLADDHAQFREGLKEMLLTDEGIEVVGEADDGAQAIEVAGRVRPDVVILDLAMPVMGGREALGPILRDVRPPPRVLILTMHGGTGQRRELLGMGASVFLTKSTSLHELLAAVKGTNS
jgi:DNA-binding NarL/FixJ family response regulator